MSETDSFINEVSEEVRRDKLFGYMRRYGWIAVVAILGIVGAAAWTEWSRAQAESRAQALGDALIAALETDDVAARATALAAVETTGPVHAVAAMLAAADQQEAGDVPAAVATLRAVAEDGAVPALYRDLAQLKMLLAGEGVIDETERRAGLEALSEPGQPFRMVALEHLALSTLAAGDVDGAIAAFEALSQDAEASLGLQDRAERLIEALRAQAGSPAEAPAPETPAPDDVVPEGDVTEADITAPEAVPAPDAPADDSVAPADDSVAPVAEEAPAEVILQEPTTEAAPVDDAQDDQ